LGLLFVKEAVYLRWLDEEFGAAEPPQIEPAVDDSLRTAPSPKIHEAITAVYDEKERAGADPPNVKKVCPLVQKKLRDEGYRATLRQIEDHAGDEKHKRRRRPPGKTIASEKRPRLA
jgi:hypothetical protein